MKFGRLEDISNVDFSLPADHPLSSKHLSKLEPSSEVEIRMGCPLWNDKAYVGSVYPPKTPVKNYLKEYAKQFNSIELNATYYNFPKPETVVNWRESVSEGFKFYPKLTQSITHRREIPTKGDVITDFIARMYELGDHLGGFFTQMPDYFKPDRIEELLWLSDQLPQDWPCSIEIRHPEWFQDKRAMERLHEHLSARNVGLIISETAGRRDAIHQMLSADHVFLRFNAYGEAIDKERLKSWSDRLDSWFKQGIRQVNFFTHQADKSLSASNIIFLGELLKKKGWSINSLPKLYNSNLKLDL